MCRQLASHQSTWKIIDNDDEDGDDDEEKNDVENYQAPAGLQDNPDVMQLSRDVLVGLKNVTVQACKAWQMHQLSLKLSMAH